MTLNLSQIKEATAKVEDAITIFGALSGLKDALNVVGQLEATRISLEPKVLSLKADVLGLEIQKDGVLKEIKDSKAELVDSRLQNKKIVSDELESGKAKARESVKKYEAKLMSELAELEVKKKELSDLNQDLFDNKVALEMEAARIQVDLAAAVSTLNETNSKITALKAQLGAIAGKL